MTQITNHIHAPQRTLDADACDRRLLGIAREYCGVTTLATRGSDRLDFFEINVATLHLVLELAYAAGFAAAQGDDADG